MPPYRREIAASLEAATNDWNRRTGCPIARLVLSSKATSPRSDVNTVAAADDCIECPDVYSGKGGVTMNGSQAGSMWRRMYVMGRMTLYSYLVCQQPMKA